MSCLSKGRRTYAFVKQAPSRDVYTCEVYEFHLEMTPIDLRMLHSENTAHGVVTDQASIVLFGIIRIPAKLGTSLFLFQWER